MALYDIFFIIKEEEIKQYESCFVSCIPRGHGGREGAVLSVFCMRETVMEIIYDVYFKETEFATAKEGMILSYIFINVQYLYKITKLLEENSTLLKFQERDKL